MATPIEICAERFGSLKAFSDAINVPYYTLTTWKNRNEGMIPAKYQALVLRTAKEHEVELEPTDVIHWGV